MAQKEAAHYSRTRVWLKQDVLLLFYIEHALKLKSLNWSSRDSGSLYDSFKHRFESRVIKSKLNVKPAFGKWQQFRILTFH